MRVKPKIVPMETREDSILTSTNAVDGSDTSLAEAFPNIEPGMKPLGNLVLVQVRRPRKFTVSGIELAAEVRATEYYNTQIAKVIALGDLCFKTVRNVGGEEVVIPWPEGPWFEPGAYVRVPKYGGDRFSVKAKVIERAKMIGGASRDVECDDDIIFAVFKAKDVQGVITGDPRLIRAYLD